MPNSNALLRYDEPDLLPETAHEEHWYRQPHSIIYEYDTAEDGPEVDVITRIRARHILYDIGGERAALLRSVDLETGARILFGRPFAMLTNRLQSVVREEVARRLASLGLA